MVDEKGKPSVLLVEPDEPDYGPLSEQIKFSEDPLRPIVWHTLADLARVLNWRTELIAGEDFTAAAAHEGSMVIVATQGHGDEEAVGGQIRALAGLGVTDFVAGEYGRGEDAVRTRALLRTLLP